MPGIVCLCFKLQRIADIVKITELSQYCASRNRYSPSTPLLSFYFGKPFGAIPALQRLLSIKEDQQPTDLVDLIQILIHVTAHWLFSQTNECSSS